MARLSAVLRLLYYSFNNYEVLFNFFIICFQNTPWVATTEAQG